jgi:hypothetical protein
LPSLLKQYAPNISGICYIAGNLMVLVSGGLSSNPWEAAAALFWLANGMIIVVWGRYAKGVNFQSLINLIGCVCFMIAAKDLAQPWGQIAFGIIFSIATLIRLFGASAFIEIQKPASRLALPFYYVRRHPMQVAAILSIACRPIILISSFLNAQPALFIAGLLWMTGDVFQFLSKKGGYHASEIKQQYP